VITLTLLLLSLKTLASSLVNSTHFIQKTQMTSMMSKRKLSNIPA
jgi:hypothetical protein